MDYLRILRVPFHPTPLIMIGVLSPLMAFCIWGAFNTPAWFAGFLGAFILQIWVFKYCYVLLEKLADGAAEPPVMDMDMLSPFEIRPWSQMALLAAAGGLCWYVGGTSGAILAIVFILWIPASVAMIGFGERPWSALNPLAVFRLVRGLGPHYLVLLAALGAAVLLAMTLVRLALPTFISVIVLLLGEIAFFALVGGVIYARRKQIGYEPSRSPERAAARAELERQKERAKMLDEVFHNVRLGKHVEATAPLAAWLRDLDADYAAIDSAFVVEKTLSWERPGALNTIGSTLIRHLLRFGRADAALAVFEQLRERSPRFTMDSAPDLRLLSEYAESVGREELAASMRLETPVFHPPA
jgi:hypothetical protein